MKDECSYTIRIHGRVDAGELNSLSPIQIAVTHAGRDATRLSFSTDQSGLLGLLSYLHGLGAVILAVRRAETTKGT